jgi:hypothetical protein
VLFIHSVSKPIISFPIHLNKTGRFFRFTVKLFDNVLFAACGLLYGGQCI